jgi:UDP-N-acetylmuramoyl-tripeptide--D-alanyl-D-alanine ligase
MEARDSKFITQACSAVFAGERAQFVARNICTDSRHVREGDLFIALAGDKFDGHDFVAEAIGRGAIAAMINRNRAHNIAEKYPLLVVDDTRKALGRLAAEYRKGFSLPIIAVGGSNGKTTTKELIASVLRQKLATVWSEASFNNEIGVPLTLLKLDSKKQAAVLEVGTNHPGELAPLARLIAPGLGVITSIGREHLEFFGDLSGVALEEGSLGEVVPQDGKLFIPGDSEWANALAKRTRAKVVRIGLGENNDWRAGEIEVDHKGVIFRVKNVTGKHQGSYRIHLVGRHQVVNALFAIAVGAELGLSRSEIQAGLAECQPAKMRMQLWEMKGVRVLDDAYNANADSMRVALEAFLELPCKGRRVAVLGDMAELGRHSEAAHEEVGRRAAELGVGQLFAVGKMASAMARGAREAGLNRVFEFTDVETAAAAVKQFVKTGDVLLLKASRATRLERVSEWLRSGEAEKRN